MQLSSLEKAYIVALREARGLGKPEVRDDTIIAYTREAEPPALILYRSLLHSGMRVQLASASEAGIHVIPYRETGPLVMFNLEKRDARVIHTLEAASLLGLEAYLVSPPMHPAYEEKLDSLGVERIVVNSQYPLLVMSLSALLWTPRMMGGREDRLRGELEELESAFSWVESRVESVRAEGLGEASNILYTPSMAPGAYYHCYTLPTCIQPAPLEYMARLTRGSTALVYVNGVEEHDYRSLLVNAAMMGIRAVQVRLNTDPVTSGLYAILAAIALTGTIL